MAAAQPSHTSTAPPKEIEALRQGVAVVLLHPYGHSSAFLLL
ncbi:hypothetical protein [Streptomyces mirabilis]